MHNLMMIIIFETIFKHDGCMYNRSDCLTSSGELHQQFGQSGGEQQSLSAVWKPPDDFLKLFGKTHFKQPEEEEHRNVHTYIHTYMAAGVNPSCEMTMKHL